MTTETIAAGLEHRIDRGWRRLETLADLSRRYPDMSDDARHLHASAVKWYTAKLAALRELLHDRWLPLPRAGDQAAQLLDMVALGLVDAVVTVPEWEAAIGDLAARDARPAAT